MSYKYNHLLSVDRQMCHLKGILQSMTAIGVSAPLSCWECADKSLPGRRLWTHTGTKAQKHWQREEASTPLAWESMTKQIWDDILLP